MQLYSRSTSVPFNTAKLICKYSSPLALSFCWSLPNSKYSWLLFIQQALKVVKTKSLKSKPSLLLFFFSQIFISKTTALVQLYLQPYLQGYPPFNNMRGMYEHITSIYEFIFKMEFLDLNRWPELTRHVVGFLEEFVNVSIRPQDQSWFPQFRYFYGKQHKLQKLFIMPAHIHPQTCFLSWCTSCFKLRLCNLLSVHLSVHPPFIFSWHLVKSRLMVVYLAIFLNLTQCNSIYCCRCCCGHCAPWYGNCQQHPWIYLVHCSLQWRRYITVYEKYKSENGNSPTLYLPVIGVNSLLLYNFLQKLHSPWKWNLVSSTPPWWAIKQTIQRIWVW